MKGLSWMEKQIIEEKLRVFLQENEELDSNVIDVVLLAKKLGFLVVDLTTEDNELEGFIMVNSSKEILPGYGKIIAVNRNLDAPDKRFVIAHELGHYVLKYNSQPLFAHRENKKGKNQEENDADYFAACLLMPAQQFSSDYHYLIEHASPEDTIYFLSHKYKVSEKAAFRRKQELKLI